MERFSYAALYHSGVKGMKKGVRQYQNPDGTWTELGKERRRKQSKSNGKDIKRKVINAAKKTGKAIAPYVGPALVAAGAAVVSTAAFGLLTGTFYTTSALGYVALGEGTVTSLLKRAGSASLNSITRKAFNEAYKKRLSHSEMPELIELGSTTDTDFSTFKPLT